MSAEKIRCVLFDLDGTLADTAPDLAIALNTLRAEQGMGPIPYQQIRHQVSHGAAALIRLGFGVEKTDPEFSELHERLLAFYRNNIACETRLFPEMGSVLVTLEHNRIIWGVVTNKPSWLTEPLLEQLCLFDRAACVVSGDSVANRKPDPEPLLHAAAHVGAGPEECIYVGDAERDIIAAKQAGMRALVALFGYIGPNETPEDWNADGQMRSPHEILTYLDSCGE